RVFPGEDFEAMYSEFKRWQLEDTPIPTKDHQEIVSAPDHHYVKRPTFTVRFYGFNTRLKPLNDRRVRQALICAIDRSSIVDGVFLGRFVPANGVLPPGTQGFNPKLRGYAHDPQRARELLAQAGYPGGRGLPPIIFWSSVRERVVTEHAQIHRDLEAV